MDNVDWKKIKQNENAAKDKANAEDGGKDDNDGDDEDDDGNYDDNLEDYSPSVIGWKEKAPLYEEIISLMQPGYTDRCYIQLMTDVKLKGQVNFIL